MAWQNEIPKNILEKMIQEKIDPLYELRKRPTCDDIFVEVALAVSKRAVCLFHEVGAVIFKGSHILSTGYNGPASGDLHCTKVGCAKIIGGEIKSGTGLCRGTHAELNAIGNAAKFGINIEGASIFVTWAPCYTCAKQLVNASLRHVLYLINYEDARAKKCLETAKISLTRYEPRLESLSQKVEELRNTYEK
ncbi:cytidine deaminase [Candidatus Parcubacteria bacterium]|nr:MAG: cytidine deaminase [Candidatus Parcubacteria bacterium]